LSSGEIRLQGGDATNAARTVAFGTFILKMGTGESYYLSV
jgi:hypothetical protein